MNPKLQTQTKMTPVPARAPMESGLLQRKCACGGTPGLDSECAECRVQQLGLQQQATNRAAVSPVLPIVHEVLRSPGQMLEASIRAFTEPSLGHDFGQVRVHTDAPQGLQASLTVKQPGDEYEQEADRVAEQVMRMPEPQASLIEQDHGAQPIVQRSPLTPGPSATKGERSGVPPIVHDVLRSFGQPLDATTRAFMEPRFGHDFSHVRVHAGSTAAQSTHAINALAYTAGNHIVFDSGQYNPATTAGKRLLAHELTHVTQQARNQVMIQRQGGTTPSADPLTEAVRIVRGSSAGLGASEITADLVQGIERAEQRFLTGVRQLAEMIGVGSSQGPTQLTEAAISDVETNMGPAVSQFAAVFGSVQNPVLEAVITRGIPSQALVAIPEDWQLKATNPNWYRFYTAAFLALSIDRAQSTFQAKDTTAGIVNLGITMYNGAFESIKVLRRDIAADRGIQFVDVTWEMIESEVVNRSTMVITDQFARLQDVINYVHTVRGLPDISFGPPF